MNNPLFRSLSLLDPSGYFIIAVIVVLLAIGIFLTVVVRARYASLAREVRRHGSQGGTFHSRVLNAIVRDTQNALSRHAGEVNTQAIIEQNFQRELAALLTAERFIKASTGLLIILGLVGTFYGLTLSIGKLVALVASGDAGGTADITQSLTSGLTQALSGMSVAFTCSLFGIMGAIIMTLLGVFANVADSRTGVMVAIEAFLDHELVGSLEGGNLAVPAGVDPNARAAVVITEQLNRAMQGFGASLSQLHEVVGRFESALVSFSTTTRDFREFNLHLKDNVQRMSLGFADLSETLKQHSALTQPRGPR